MWLEVTAKDAAGNALYQSGAVDGEGNIAAGAVIFNAVAMDKDDHHTAKPWEIVRFESVSTIQPKGAVQVPYAFLIPAGTKGPVTVDVTLRYRSFAQSLANMLLGDSAPVIPIVDMVSASGKIAVP